VKAKDAANAHKIPRVFKGGELLFIIIYCHKNIIRTSLFATCKWFYNTRLFSVKY